MRIPTYLALSLLLLSVGCTPKHYTATAIIQIIRDDPSAMSSEANRLRAYESKIEAAVVALESITLLKKVIEKLESSNQVNNLIIPYKKEATTESLVTILKKYRSIEVARPSQLLHVSYAHPDPEIAALVVNTFAKEYIDYAIKLDFDSSMKAIEALRIRTDQQKIRIAELEQRLTQDNLTAEEISSLERDLKVQSNFHMALLSRIRSEKTHINLRVPPARIIDLASPPKK